MAMLELTSCSVVLLSGGRGSRMGQSKGLVEVEGRPWIAWQIEALQAIGFKQIIVVTGYESGKYREILPGTVINAVNPNPELGQFSSMQTGLAHLESRYCFVHPVDVAVPIKEVWSKLFEALLEHGLAVAAVPETAEKRGHPVLLKENLCKRLLAVDPESPLARLDYVLRGLSEHERIFVKVEDPTVFQNLNHPIHWKDLSLK